MLIALRVTLAIMLQEQGALPVRNAVRALLHHFRLHPRVQTALKDSSKPGPARGTAMCVLRASSLVLARLTLLPAKDAPPASRKGQLG